MKNGATPLYVASQEGYTDIVKLLLKTNANPTFKTNGITPLFMARQSRHLDIVSLLLNADSDTNFQANDGASPLFYIKPGRTY